MKELIKIPELTLLLIFIVAGYTVIALFNDIHGTELLHSANIIRIIIGSFVFSTILAILSVIAGVGGGVIYTPVMLAFTSIDTLVIRATGLVVAMFSGLISTGPFMRKGLSDVKIAVFVCVPIIVGAISGAISAVYFSKYLGATGDSIVRMALGLVLLSVAFIFIFSGSKTEYPRAKKVDNLSEKLGLKSFYWEEYKKETVHFQVHRGPLGALLFILVGFNGGFFGMGGGAFIVPVLNLVMMVPIKVSAACSGVLLSIANTAAIWPYILIGAMIPVFAAPWMLGQVVGGIIGARTLARINASYIRKILIIILLLTSLKLLIRGLEGIIEFNIPFI